ncbi:YqkE family protein [Sutcliffiella halmapala]|uniref:YqkE family protein n=1 Tax=Sutcliffiella halmapala TaxID=79882 RepID=UPI000995DDA0|nr:YqkE family protein [Sutcliffiella halmapala]
MKKKQRKNVTNSPKSKDDKLSLKDQLQDDVFSKLKSMKEQLMQTEHKAKEEEAARIKEEKRLKEKNKSFEELLEESSQNWKEFK